MNWKEMSENQARGLADRMFDKAGITKEVRQEYYDTFNAYVEKVGKEDAK